jgi:gamma-glutamyltranspeptidase/glutathione hydrolase
MRRAPGRPHLRFAALLLASLVTCQVHAPRHEAQVPPGWTYALHEPSVTAAHGMVVSDSALASHVGAQVLAAGGNAVDAAVAVAFAMAVALPEAGNLGGGGFAVVRAADGTTHALDFRETAPRAATRDMYLGKDGTPAGDSLAGPRASAVPGAVAGLFALHQKLGARPWAELVAPAVRLAEAGFAVDDRLRSGVLEARDRLVLSAASRALYLPGGDAPAVGATFRNPDLAATLRRIAADGPADFYRGRTAELIGAEMAAGGGLITAADLAAYEVRWRTPVESTYRGRRLVAMPPPSSGGIAVAQIARLLEAFDLRRLGWHSPAHLTLLAEAEQRAFADRNELLGDPDFLGARPDLLGDDYIARRRATLDPGRATPSSSVRPGLIEGANTTHLAVVDGQGAAVALTTTLNELYGSGVTIAGAGFLMNDEMDDFSTKPGASNLFGLVQGAANRIEPGKRPLSSMAPTIVVDEDGRVLMVAGGRGGSRIISATFQVLSNVLDFGMDAAAAVAAPRVHHQHVPDVLYYEAGGLPDATLGDLGARGFSVKPMKVIASSPVLVRTGAGWSGFADPRRGGAAEGY